ncbi:MAG TPA: hypothetical protein VGC13_22375 [Longimicrobium sp.]
MVLFAFFLRGSIGLGAQKVINPSFHITSSDRMHGACDLTGGLCDLLE